MQKRRQPLPKTTRQLEPEPARAALRQTAAPLSAARDTPLGVIWVEPRERPLAPGRKVFFI